MIQTHRRDWFKQVRGLGFLALGFCFNPIAAFAKNEDAAETIKKITGGAKVQEGRVNLVILPLVENGNLVVLKVSVDSPITANDYVKADSCHRRGQSLA